MVFEPYLGTMFVGPDAAQLSRWLEESLKGVESSFEFVEDGVGEELALTIVSVACRQGHVVMLVEDPAPGVTAGMKLVGAMTDTCLLLEVVDVYANVSRASVELPQR